MSLQVPKYQQRLFVQPANDNRHAEIKVALVKELLEQASAESELATTFRPEDYVLENWGGSEYFRAVRSERKFLNAEPNLDPPSSKIRGYKELFSDPLHPIEPVRKIPKSPKMVRGVKWNTKAGHPAEWESSVERDYINLLEFDPNVRTYVTQPIVIDWKDRQGKWHEYTPDVFVEFEPFRRLVPTAVTSKSPFVAYKEITEPKPLLAEVKTEEDLKKNALLYKEKFNAARKFAATQGWDFKVVSDTDIRTPYLQNISKLHLPLTTESSPDRVRLARLLIRALFKKERSTPNKLVTALPKKDRGAGRFVLWMLVARREILCNLHEPISNDTEIWLSSKHESLVTITSILTKD